MTIIGYLLNQSILKLSFENTFNLKGWIVTSVTFIFLNSIVTISLALMVNALKINLEKEQRLTIDLKSANEQLELDQKKRTAVEKELVKSKKMLTQAIDGTTIPTFILDTDHVITHWNQACAKMTGLSANKMVGTKNQWLALYTNERPLLADLILDKCTEEKISDFFEYNIHKSPLIEGGYAGEIHIPAQNNNLKWFFLTASPLRNEDGSLSGAIETLMDISDSKIFEHQLAQSQKMESIGRLAGGVAHDYNNISSIIIGYAELALNKIEQDSKLQKYLTEILEAALRSSNVTKQLLAFARQQTIAPKVLDLNRTIENMLNMLQRMIGEDIHLEWVPGKETWAVKTDPSQIDQILANLCVNARDAINDTGHVCIETGNVSFDDEYCADHAGFVKGEYVMIAVSDDGSGITKEKMAMIFEPFFTTKNTGKGTGLGLATVYGIAKQNNGFVNVYSEPDKGTTLRVYLPRHLGKIIESQQDDRQELPESLNETVLIVEDNTSILELEKILLNDMGYKVLSTTSPNEAIQMGTEFKEKINLLITDVVMPEMNGRELSEKLKNIFPDIKVLFMSGYTANVIVHRRVLDEGVNFISKPFSKKDLQLKVREVLDNHKNP